MSCYVGDLWISRNKTCFLKKRAPRTFPPVLVSKILEILRNYSFILLASLALPQPYLHLFCILIPNLLILSHFYFHHHLPPFHVHSHPHLSYSVVDFILYLHLHFQLYCGFSFHIHALHFTLFPFHPIFVGESRRRLKELARIPHLQGSKKRSQKPVLVSARR